LKQRKLEAEKGKEGNLEIHEKKMMIRPEDPR
jgi:hypothetical protein